MFRTPSGRRTSGWTRLTAIGFSVGSLLGGAAIIATAGPAGAVTHTRYVAFQGSDNAGANSCLNPSNPCLTLLHAYNEAAGGDTISLSPGTYKGLTFSQPILKNLTIEGTGTFGSLDANTTTISAQGSDIALYNEANLKLIGVVVNDAKEVAVENFGTLTMTNDILGWGLDTTAVSVPGEGLENVGGTVTMTGGEIEGDTVIVSGGGFFNFSGTASFKNVSFTHDTATGPLGEGGAIFNCSGTVHLTGTTSIHNSSATVTGGGIESKPGATTTIGAGVVNTGNTPNNFNNTNPSGFTC